MYSLINATVRVLRHIVPEPIVRLLRKPYHACLAFITALSYGFPAKKLVVIGVTGTKGKSTVAEMLFAILRAARHNTALISTIRFAINEDSTPNLYKMTLPGRGFIQAFMHKALRAECTHVVIELTSEGTLQYRHWFLSLDGLIVTNIQKEHIERHGSFENYVAAKRSLVEALARSKKPRHLLVLNDDDEAVRSFADVQPMAVLNFSTSDLDRLVLTDRALTFSYRSTPFSLPLVGSFNALNALAAIKMGEALDVPRDTIQKALATLAPVRGRVEHVECGQSFVAVVDYAHTPDSLRALYGAFPHQRKICVLGNTGGGRDTWKRPEMGKIADETCDEVILTNEDPYDEDPRAIVEDMTWGMHRAPTIIMNRREAIRHALSLARPGDAVLVSGKGTDPFIMEAGGAKTPWSDAAVVREELEKLLRKQTSS